jgi:cyclopropane fatty-acyl-phospholipid synthase-like methyltransferase
MYDDITAIYDQIFPLNQAFLDFIPAYLGPTGSKVLDLGCGPGDYVDYLTGFGYAASGIDSSAEMIRQAQTQKRGTFFNYSFTDIHQLADAYDCIFSMGNSLSYLPVKGMTPFFGNVFSLLNMGGYFVMQVVNWDKFDSTAEMIFDVKRLADGRTFHRRYQPSPDGTVIFHTELRKGDQLQGSWSDPLYPKLKADLDSQIEACGLKVSDMFGDFQNSPFDPLSSPATIMVVQKLS